MKSPIQSLPTPITMTLAVYEKICDTIGAMPAEQGGMLGGNREKGLVTHFCFDESPASRSGGTYYPNTTHLSEVLKTQWKPQGAEFMGFIHTHPPLYQQPSPGDRQYAETIIGAMALPYMLMPIAVTPPDTNTFTILPFVALSTDSGLVIRDHPLTIEGLTELGVGRLLTPQPQSDLTAVNNLTKQMLVVVGGAGLLTVGIATAQLIRALRHYQQLNGGQ